MSEASAPALTPEEWLMAQTAGLQVATRMFVLLQSELVEMRDRAFGADPVEWSATFGSPERRRQLAALLLADPAIGFTWADVDALQSEASALADGEDADPFTYREAGRLRDLAERIAALLPPREP